MDMKLVTLAVIFSGVTIPQILAYRELAKTEREFKNDAENDAMQLAQLIIRRASFSAKAIK